MRTLGIVALLLAAPPEFAQQGPAGRGGPAPGQSPASQRPPATTVPQSYSAGQIQAGEPRFVSECGFCHGRDAQGGESGPDLTRSSLVAEDVRGDKIGPVIVSGRADKGMPAFALPAADVAAIVAFIHDEKSKAESAAGGRRSVDLSDLQTGNVEAGKRYFSGEGGCIKCHALGGTFATVGARFQGLALLQRMLNPSRGPRAGPFLPAVTITTALGQKVTGKLAYRDEFTVTMIDPDGWTRSWPAADVKIESAQAAGRGVERTRNSKDLAAPGESVVREFPQSEDPLQAHFEQLGRYTDEEIHDVFAFLQTLR